MHFTRLVWLVGPLCALLLTSSASAQYPDWKHSGSVWILTDKEGADLPAEAVVEQFPLLVKLYGDWFDFKQAQPRGEDLRFATKDGSPLAYEIDEWDSAKGEAAIWVRVPKIVGNTRQELRVFWGKSDAKSESNGAAVFNESNGYVAVWHMNDRVADATGTYPSTDTGTTETTGMIGRARHFPGGKGIFCGDKLETLPSGASSHSTEAWFRIERPNTTLIGWGNEGGGRGSKVHMMYRGPHHIRIDSDFADVRSEYNQLQMQEWLHIAHTYDRDDGRLYIDGRLSGEGKPTLNIKSPARLWLGGWYHNYDYVGDLDEVRISKVARSAHWLKLQHENQKPLQTLVGHIVQPGNEFSVSYAITDGAKAITRRGQVVQSSIFAVQSRASEQENGSQAEHDQQLHHSRKLNFERPDPAFNSAAPKDWKPVTEGTEIEINEGQTVTFRATAGGAQRVAWFLGPWGDGFDVEVLHPANVNRFTSQVTTSHRLQFLATYPDSTKRRSFIVKVRNPIPRPEIDVLAPNDWDGRHEISVLARISNRDELKRRGIEQIELKWSVEGLPVSHQALGDRLVLKRSQGSGTLNISVFPEGFREGFTFTAQAQIKVAASPSNQDVWLARTPDSTEQPEDNQFIARDDKVEGTLHYTGMLTDPAESVFVRLYADEGGKGTDNEKLIKTESSKVAADKSYALAVKLKAGLIKYRAEFGTKTGDKETVLHSASNLVCGDVFLLNGQSNTVATDFGKENPLVPSDWIRTFGATAGDPNGSRLKLWANAQARSPGGKSEIGYWGMELGRRLVESQKRPVCFINGAVGGTRIDQHQRNDKDPTDPSTIYGRLLWRAQQAKLTHGVRAILWHQGENDQGADGPSGNYGYITYRDLFFNMAASWKNDYPNVGHYYVFQIWPKACAMGLNGSDNELREIQRTLPNYFSNLSVMSTLGIKPPGGCHFPAEGYAEFARLIAPVIEQKTYGRSFDKPVTPPNLKRAFFSNKDRDEVTLEFDQPVVWDEKLKSEFVFRPDARDLEPDQPKPVGAKVVSGSSAGSTLVLKLDRSAGRTVSYIDSDRWSPDRLLYGANGLAALSFWDVEISTND